MQKLHMPIALHCIGIASHTGAGDFEKLCKNWNILCFLLSCKSIKYCEFMMTQISFLFALLWTFFFLLLSVTKNIPFFFRFGAMKCPEMETESQQVQMASPIEARGCALHFWINCVALNDCCLLHFGSLSFLLTSFFFSRLFVYLLPFGSWSRTRFLLLLIATLHNFQLQSVMPTVREIKRKLQCWCNEHNLWAMYPSYVNNNISPTPTVFTMILWIDDGIRWVYMCGWFDSSAI